MAELVDMEVAIGGQRCISVVLHWFCWLDKPHARLNHWFGRQGESSGAMGVHPPSVLSVLTSRLGWAARYALKPRHWSLRFSRCPGAGSLPSWSWLKNACSMASMSKVPADAEQSGGGQQPPVGVFGAFIAFWRESVPHLDRSEERIAHRGV